MNRIVCITAMGCAAVMLITGCQGSREKYTFRETGIQQLNSGNYEEAIQSFEQALEHSDGLVGVFELDVLKYRAEAEYQVEDYAAAAHTYEVLIQADKPLPEYRDMQNMLYIKAGELDKALAAYQAAYPGAGDDNSDPGKNGAAGKNSDPGKDTNPGTTESAVRESILLSLGQALTDAGRFEEAGVLYQQAQSDGMASGELYNRLGLYELKAENPDRALEYFAMGEQQPDSEAQSRILYNKAVAYEQKLDFAKALELLESYVSAYGSTPEVEKEMAFLKTRVSDSDPKPGAEGTSE